MYFCFNDTATTEIYTLSLRDALPISRPPVTDPGGPADGGFPARDADPAQPSVTYGLAATSVPSASSLIRKSSNRSEEHTSELQSRQYLVCRLLLEKKNRTLNNTSMHR